MMDIAMANKKVFASTGGRPIDRDRPLVILLHGAGQDRTIWFLQTRYLAHHGLSVLAVDLPGHGGSDGPPLASIEAMSDWTFDLIGAVGAGSASLVGHSMGSLVALQCAADHPGQIDKVALVGVAAQMPVNPQMLAAAEADEQHAVDLMVGWSHSSAGHRGGHQQPGIWMLGGSKRIVERSAPGVLFTDFTACINRGSILDAAARVKAPTLFLLAGDDKMTPSASGVVVAREVMDAAVVILPKVGHSMLAEAPDLVTRRLTAFLAVSP
jgi:pimeloyl-ACP methyl ester carboxylesterase